MKLFSRKEKKVVEEKTIEQQVIEVLKTIYDPEIPVNIYALGLIYNIDISEDNEIEIDMTLTSPACPVAETLPPMIERALLDNIKETKYARITVVWEPPWDQTKMSEEAKLELGML
jgi:FeS assembly SUF system protein